MWICGQDQKVRKAVSYYFNDPYNTSMIGTSRQPNRTGSVSEMLAYGSVPDADSAALGRGRRWHSPPAGKAMATQLVSKYINENGKALTHWREQARVSAARDRDVLEKRITKDRAALRQLEKCLQSEVIPEITAAAQGVQRDLLSECLRQVNWLEIAEDLLGQ
jgi:hypothetical protein